jgi:hypothetical protein
LRRWTAKGSVLYNRSVLICVEEEAAVGAWGTALFSDDIAWEVRDLYKDLLADGLDDAEAARQALSKYGAANDDWDNAVVFWVALAVTQSRLGRLDPAVAERALKLLDEGGDLWRWQEAGPKKVAQRKAVLEKARAQLTGPQPPRRTIRLPKTPLRPGDVLTRPVQGDRYLLLRVARIKRGIPVMVMLDFAGRQVPALDQIAQIPDHLWVDRWRPDGIPLGFSMSIYRRIDHARAGYVVVGNIGTRPGDEDRDDEVLRDWQDDLTTGHPGYDVLARG